MQNDREKFKQEFKKRLYTFVLKTISFIDKLPSDNVSKRICDQLLRSSTSILGNLIEAQAASSRKEFTNYFSISLKSANESKLWLTLLKDTKRANSTIITGLLTELTEIANIFGSSVLRLKDKK